MANADKAVNGFFARIANLTPSQKHNVAAIVAAIFYAVCKAEAEHKLSGVADLVPLLFTLLAAHSEWFGHVPATDAKPDDASPAEQSTREGV